MAFSALSASAKEDMVVSLATLVLHDGGKPVTVRSATCGVPLRRWPLLCFVRCVLRRVVRAQRC